MLPKKYLALIVVGLLAVGVGVVVTWDNAHKDADGYYDYDISYSDSFESWSMTITAPKGETFAIVDVVVKNVSYEKGISTKPAFMYWELKLDSMTFNVSLTNTVLHPDYWDMKIDEGRTWGYTVVFLIPEEFADQRGASLDYWYLSLGEKLDLKYDPELRLKTF